MTPSSHRFASATIRVWKRDKRTTTLLNDRKERQNPRERNSFFAVVRSRSEKREEKKTVSSDTFFPSSISRQEALRRFAVFVVARRLDLDLKVFLWIRVLNLNGGVPIIIRFVNLSTVG